MADRRFRGVAEVRRPEPQPTAAPLTRICHGVADFAVTHQRDLRCGKVRTRPERVAREATRVHQFDGRWYGRLAAGRARAAAQKNSAAAFPHF
jgi:hypothetical protein